jgi:Domain of unknown function (DUF4440)
VILGFLALAALQSAVVPTSASVQGQLRAYDQALLDAIAPGDRALWDRYLTKDALYIDENGAIMSREKFLAELNPLPQGSSGHIAIVEYQAAIHGGIALVVHRDDEYEDYHGIPLRAGYLMTETWIKEGPDWRLAMVHAYVIPKDPPAQKTPEKLLNDYVGQYRAAADLVYSVRREGPRLVGQSIKGPSVALIQESPDVFFVAGKPRDRKIFTRDEHHKIVNFVDRREGEDLVYRRTAP